MVVGLFPPGRADPQGMHGATWSNFDQEPYALPQNLPLTVATYPPTWEPEAWIEHMAVGSELPEMPLFLTEEVCVRLPLQTTYDAAFRDTPAFWRDVLEGRREAAG